MVIYSHPFCIKHAENATIQEYVWDSACWPIFVLAVDSVDDGPFCEIEIGTQ